MSNTFDKLSVLDSFIEEVNSYLPEIEANLARLAQSPGDMEAIEETYRRTHTIGGSASMMDFSGLAHVAHGMEDILADALDGITILDEPTISLLLRSLGRIHRLLDGISSGVDEDAVIAEDDADYDSYRASIEVPAQAAPTAAVRTGNTAQTQSAVPPISVPPSSPSLPSFDEVLASFRTPSLALEDDMAWPEEHVLLAPTSHVEAYAAQPSEEAL